MGKQPCTYILASGRLGTIYVGITSDIAARLYRHRCKSANGFTARYGALRLVRYERFADMPAAIAREKQLKRWHREWKVNLIERDNPEWLDLAPEVGLPVAAGGAKRARGESGTGSAGSRVACRPGCPDTGGP